MIAILARDATKAREVFRNSSLMKYDFVYVGTRKKVDEVEEITGILDYKDSYEHKLYKELHCRLLERFPGVPVYLDWRDMV